MSLQAETSGSLSPPAADPARALRGLAALAFKRVLSHLQSGSLSLELPSGQRIDHRAEKPGIEAQLTIHKWRALRRLMGNGDLGFAKAYIDGDWSTPDLAALLELAATNGGEFIDKMSGRPLFRAINWLTHSRRENTRSGSRKNIEFHYDLGNEFYQHWLDPSMLYSSAVYSRPDQSLEDAQANKVNQILEMLGIEPGDRVLEIGCGWAALAAAMATVSKSRVTGITLSPSQLAFGRERIAGLGLADTVDLKLEDYRDTRGEFDRIVSIEMIEAVGHKYWPSYFGTLRDRLKPGGIAVIQAITIAEDRFESYRARPDFIQRYIFPGGFLPTKTAIESALAQADLRLIATRHFGESYALTLAEWRRRFNEAWPRIEKLGFDASFKRLWEYYLCYCEAGFKTGVIDVGLYSIGHAR